MTSPCLNCHGAPHTTSWDEPGEAGECRVAEGTETQDLSCLYPIGPESLRENPEELATWRRWARELSPRSFSISPLWRPAPEPLPDCPAESRWPEELREAHVALQNEAWWVRGNFERTRESPVPVRIDVERADLSVFIHPRTGASIPIAGGWLSIEAGLHASLSTHQVVEHNEISLVMNHLVDFEHVSVRGPLGIDIPLQQVNVGNFGGLHALAQVPTWTLFFIQPFMVPVPPPGHDDATLEQYRELYRRPYLADHCMVPSFAMEHQDVCPPMLMYPDRRNPVSTLDLNLLAFLPERLRCLLTPLLNAERLPQYLDLETLISFFTSAGENSCPPATTPTSPLNLQDLVSDAELLLNLEDLRDLFVPGVVDLGPSQGRLRVSYEASEGIVARLEDLDLNLEAMGYGSRRLDEGYLASASEDPALQIRFQPETGVVELDAALRISLDQEGFIPGFGRSTLEGDLRIHAELMRTPEGLRPLPGTLTVEFSSLEVIEPGASGATPTRLNIRLTDDPREMDTAHAALSAMQDPAPIRLQIDGLWRGRAIEVEAELNWRRDHNGLYEMPNLQSLPEILGTFPLESLRLAFLSPAIRDSWAGELRMENLSVPDENDIIRPHLSASFALNHARGDGSYRPVIENGTLDFHYLEAEGEIPPHDRGEIRIHADAVESIGAAGRFNLQDIEARLSVDRLRISEGESRIRIPHFSISANPRGAPGRLRGPLRIAQSGSEGLEFVWDARRRVLEMSGLDLNLNAQGLAVLPERLRRTLDPDVATLGLDGRLAGDFRMHLTEDRRCWHGEGEISLRGDEAGDIYFLDRRGRRVGAALFRDTSWSFREVSWINWERGYALGTFRLDTLLNPSAVPGFVPFSSEGAVLESSEPLFGPNHTRLLPYEISAVMVYDNQPWSGSGFRHRIEDYLLNLYVSPRSTLRTASPRVPDFCREGAGGDR